ncbi:uncharacterized protein LOC129752138 [Uranotaenia lowii]|uniref:uncharacterized protein LOC129752138 n=1 Tax=Uranotaenia lowii TaxID=190385 RepID=UPI00247A5B4A|nr:uncharacterized protein LOC129752138 [Uranotaenia lowii]
MRLNRECDLMRAVYSSICTSVEMCEEHFKQTVQRDDSGRYVVRLPMRTEMVSLLGDSNALALRRFKSMERNFAADKTFVKPTSISWQITRSLDIWSTTTKIRVVFDGSCRGSTHLCLNDVLYTGHSVQPALNATVFNFRMPLYVVTADIEKMFRQILSPPRRSKVPANSLENQAVRTNQHLVADEGEYYPLAAQILRNGTYKGDILTSHNDPKTLEDSCHELIEMLSKAVFVLRKFATNDQSILSKTPSELWELKNVLELDRTAAIKTLDLLWFPHSDSLRFKVPFLPESSGITKRIVVS